MYMSSKKNDLTTNDDHIVDDKDDLRSLIHVGTANTMTSNATASWDMEDYCPNDTTTNNDGSIDIDTTMAHAEQYNVHEFCNANATSNDDTDGTEPPSLSSSLPLLPWWKRRNYQFACCFMVIIVALAGTAVYLVVGSMDSWVLGRNNESAADNAATSKDTMGNQQGNGGGPTQGSNSTKDDRTTPTTTTNTTTNATTTNATAAPTSSPTEYDTVIPTATTTIVATDVTPITYTPTTFAPSTTPSATPSFKQQPEIIPELFGFYFMGDIPYAPWEEVVLQEQLDNFTLFPDVYYNNNTQFIIHIGDMQKPDRTLCALSRYTMMRNMFLNSQLPLPVLAMPGDNDWIDCADPTQSIQYFRSELTHLAEEFPWNNDTSTNTSTNTTTASGNTNTTTTMNGSSPLLQRMNISYHPDYPEVFSFSKYGILFASVHLVNSKAKDSNDDWNARMTMNYEWIQQQVQAFYSNDNNTTTTPITMRAMILFGHSQLSPDILEFFSAIAPMFRDDAVRQYIPVYYFHGDGHHFNITDTRVSSHLNWNTFHDIQVDQGAYCDPLLVEIMTGASSTAAAASPDIQNNMMIAQNENQHVLGGILRVDRRRGRYNDPKNK